MANTSDNKIDLLKRNLFSASKKKLRKDIEGLKLRNMERHYSEELTSVEAEVEIATEHLKDMNNKISTFRHQISLIEICAISEKEKILIHTADLNQRKINFDDIYYRVRHVTELRNIELNQKEEEAQEMLRQKEQESAQKIEELGREISVAEKDCEIIERECAVLRKRNNAIMLKMRRKLIETENIRKDLISKKGVV